MRSHLTYAVSHLARHLTCEASHSITTSSCLELSAPGLCSSL